MSSINTQAQSPGDTKEAVLNVAQRLMIQLGYDGFSMRDLAQHCGLAKATLYHHFADKHEIIFQVLQRELSIIQNALVTAAEIPGDIHSRLRNIIVAYFKIVTERGMVLASTLRQASKSENEFIKIMNEYRDELHSPIMKILTEAQKSGEIGTIETDMVTVSIFGILQAFTSNYLFMQNCQLDDKMIDFITNFVLNGIQNHSGDHHQQQSCMQVLKNHLFSVSKTDQSTP